MTKNLISSSGVLKLCSHITAAKNCFVMFEKVKLMGIVLLYILNVMGFLICL